jgi:hypothetical protein
MDIVRKLENIADASLRVDGTDMPLGEQCREAAREIERLRELLWQYRDDMRYPPSGDSRARRIEAINAVIGKQ